MQQQPHRHYRDRQFPPLESYLQDLQNSRSLQVRFPLQLLERQCAMKLQSD